MKCNLKFTGERDGRGWVKYVCQRCRRKLDWTPDGPEGVRGNTPSIRCKGWPLSHEFGHWLALLLSAVGLRKRDYLWLKSKLGMKPKCGCDKREEALNNLGRSLAAPRREG